MKDPYSVLGVARTAKPQEIKSAFRKLAKQYHPDYHQGDLKAKEKFSEINQAYEILGDKEKKAQYDRGEIDAKGDPIHRGFGGSSGFGSMHQEGNFSSSGFNFGAGGGFDASDLFRDLFGGAKADNAGFGARQNAPRKGADIRAKLSVSLEQLVHSEKVEVVLPNGNALKIKLPHYVEEGQTIRLRHQGEQVAVGTAGDALITIHIKKHPKFRVEGRALHLDLPISLKDAILGTKAEVETLEGRVALTIPAWSSSDLVLRLKGKGLPLKNQGRADLYVHIQIVLPKNKPESLADFVKQNL